jgi:hypothetical protein
VLCVSEDRGCASQTRRARASVQEMHDCVELMCTRRDVMRGADADAWTGHMIWIFLTCFDPLSGLGSCM